MATEGEQVIINADAEAVAPLAAESEEADHAQRYGGRTEAQILAREPIAIVLGAKTYQIRPATIRVSREWAKAYSAMLAEALSLGKIDTDDPERFTAGFERLLGASPEAQLNLICLYSGGTIRDRNEIEETATPEQVALAFGKVVKLATAPLDLTQMAMG